MWRPRIVDTWQVQLSGDVDTTVEADVFDVDLFDTPSAVVERLHDQGRKVVCYFSAGTFEDWRPDAHRFAGGLIGKPLEDWPGEFWLDVRQIDALMPVLEARLDLCRDKGFDGVDPDNVDGFTNVTGFPISADDQLRFNRALAREAHERGLAVGLKNDVSQIRDLVVQFDFAVNEQCFAFSECERVAPFTQSGKPVVHIEYDLEPRVFCGVARSLLFFSMRKPLGLTAPRSACPRP